MEQEQVAAAVDQPVEEVAAVEPPVVEQQIAAVDPPAPSPTPVVAPAPASSAEPTAVSSAASPHLSAANTNISKTQCLVLNAGSSSLKYAVFDVVGTLHSLRENKAVFLTDGCA